MVDHLPLPLLTHAYEVGLSVVFALLALPALDGRIASSSIHAAFPYWMAQAWAVALLVSAVGTLLGLFFHRPRLEWLGQNWMGWTLTVYGLAILIAARNKDSAVIVGAVFLTLGAIGFLRSFKVTSAPYIQYRLAKEAQEATIRATTARRRRGRK